MVLANRLMLWTLGHLTDQIPPPPMQALKAQLNNLTAVKHSVAGILSQA